ncbi:hypothetical protein F5B21DRAFT_488745 [Xylaria acuta]|nr:hypothetical protein F5B21DRAFT_488745 [Xylaria acuta]
MRRGTRLKKTKTRGVWVLSMDAAGVLGVPIRRDRLCGRWCDPRTSVWYDDCNRECKCVKLVARTRAPAAVGIRYHMDGFYVKCLSNFRLQVLYLLDLAPKVLEFVCLSTYPSQVDTR